ncbi:MAG: hypothetical protein A3I05_04575 [Deltaproteobacteria bacterium RIFCSPLOWO2_02_FULL_44_10]|nr:MAG: hypothetical protein A3C46_07380 [Deltaproteobacteria bacterium RIFCSPHIGHO2_02_FULL_44_16]OGQ46632.1 MAG: hypothetical protein A3I05_04575 [Deltaproteobacteria bacterium RIFCSPLOWO2_02_FULL_44_10]
MANNIETIFTHDSGKLGIDEKSQLYWNDKLVVTKGMLTLQWWVSLAVIISAVSTLFLAVMSGLAYWKPNSSNSDECLNKNSQIMEQPVVQQMPVATENIIKK